MTQMESNEQLTVLKNIASLAFKDTQLSATYSSGNIARTNEAMINNGVI